MLLKYPRIFDEEENVKNPYILLALKEAHFSFMNSFREFTASGKATGTRVRDPNRCHTLLMTLLVCD
jgi:hypothetical protein